MASSKLHWPGLRFPPINLWVMSAWQDMARKQYQHRIRNPIESEKLRRTFLNLLAARGGRHGH